MIPYDQIWPELVQLNCGWNKLHWYSCLSLSKLWKFVCIWQLFVYDAKLCWECCRTVLECYFIKNTIIWVAWNIQRVLWDCRKFVLCESCIHFNVNDDNIEKVKEVVLENRHISIRKLKEALVDRLDIFQLFFWVWNMSPKRTSSRGCNREACQHSRWPYIHQQHHYWWWYVGL